MIVALSAPDIFVILIAAVGGLLAGTIIRLVISSAARRRRESELSDGEHEPAAPHTTGGLQSSGEKEREGDDGAPPADTA